VLKRKIARRPDTGLVEHTKTSARTFRVASGKVEDFPFDEKHLIENLFLREFKDTVDDEELIWHQDREDRIITVLESNKWKLQMDNQLPIMLETGKKYSIPAMSFHRVIKGDGALRIIVEKKNETPT
jgi:hypothetical protein